VTLSRAQMAAQRFEAAVSGYERALALCPEHAVALAELAEARAAAAAHAAHARAVAAAATQSVAAARQHALRHGVSPPPEAGGAAAADAGANGNGHASGGGGARGVVRPRGGFGDAARPREHRRGLWGGDLDAEDAAEAEPPAAQQQRVHA
jgi:hypothetical protein